ncbi:DNA polymerase III subunit gamma/tau [Candidatus Saccharibacteria bacterium]|nr:DNA polymerase III subunit gamma/tau [Candidatus Saccharibacteria bacterium]
MKALYRKYRPTKISDVIGEDQVTTPLASALKSGKFSHSYLFTGPRGCGKTSVARIFAHEVNHFPYEIEDSYTDIIEIDAASNTGVDNIRELREKAAIAPSKGKYKVYIIDEVHMLSKSAFNALLKTLEEPPAHVIFIMATTDAYKVPITITSRAQVYNFQLASPDVMLKHLRTIAKNEKIAIDDDALGIIVARGGGSFRDSISLLDQISTLSSDDKSVISKEMVESALGLPEETNCLNLLKAYEEQDQATITHLLKTILSTGTKPEIVAENIIARIIENPKPELLPLLAKLPEVKSPFAEAKILLAFLGYSSAQADTRTFAASKPTKAAPVAAQTAQTMPASVKTVQQATPEIENRKEPKPAKPTEPSKPDTKKTEFDWDAYINNIEAVNIGISTTLKKCRFIFNNDTLQIITERKIHKTILSSTNNLKVLQKFLPEGIMLEIGDATEIASSSSKYEQISDIMGDVTEVKADGVPF